MAKEYIEREAALNEAQEVYHWCGHENRYSDFVPVDAIRAIPAADVVEVVRCRNCKHVMLSSIWNPQCCKHEMPVKEDDFCSFGERGDNESDPTKERLLRACEQIIKAYEDGGDNNAQ